MLTDVGKGFLPYQRRLVAAGMMSRFRLARGVTNLTGAGLDLADRVIAAMTAGAGRRWDLELVAHPPLCRSDATWRFAKQMSAAFDCYELAPQEYLWFDTNLAHLDWLRERIGGTGEQPLPRAVASSDGVYRPVADVSALIRDEFIAPSLGVHIAAHTAGRTEAWRGILDLVAEVAQAVGVPGLLVERRAPAHYARRAVAAVLPSPQGLLEPWMLAYELGPDFDTYLGRPDVSVFEIGITSRVLAFAAQLQNTRAAVFGSGVTPTQVAIDLRAAGADDVGLRERSLSRTAGLRTSHVTVGDRSGRPVQPPTIDGLAPVLHNPSRDSYRLLLEDYRIEHPCDRSLPDVVALADRRLRATQEDLLSNRLGDALTDTEPVRDGESPPPGTVLAGLPGAWAGARLDPRILG
ncbi:hypothetical protein [Streptomyces sp. NBC_00576]|uniref:hypothetical protein n=1 Tax=Streptomyces sp. NBC_00576 TaxID=2903665 RepID=UPI002E816CBD|nr:hypothetical protein [Streptomyces sp. NBC_00576]WUB72728.1 hypothetical protein OG734_22910 [Streptomyces sp. NBC_00576]